MFFSPKQQNKNKSPVRGKSKKKNPKFSKSEKIELIIKKRINPKRITVPPTPSHFQAAKSPKSIIERVNVNKISLIEKLDELGKVSPKVSKTTVKISKTLNKWAKKRIVEINF